MHIKMDKSGKPAPSTAGDGIADAWKSAHGIDSKAPNAAKADQNRDGYTLLEKYANDLAGD